MDLDFGHGFIPRIGTDNYRAVDRCTGPTTLFDTALDLPWAIVDGAWAEPKVELLKALKQHGTKLLVDTAGWRYRYDATLEVRKLREASWAPATAITMTDRKGVAALVRASMRAQATIGADAYLLPGWLPETPTEDLIGVYETILETASSFDDVDAKPLVQFVGGHTKGIDEVVRILDHLPHFVSAVYLQLSPIHPAKDSPSKLEALADVYRHVAQGGFKVIAGHAGAIVPHLRSLGIDAADAGLATSETFDRSRARQPQTRSEESSNGGGRRSRMYFGQLGMSLGAKDIERSMTVPAAAAELTGCRLPCHRFRPDHLLDQAREHSLWTRVEEAVLVGSLPATMRASSVFERMRNQRSVLSRVNSALEAAGQPPLPLTQIDNHLAWFSRTLAGRRAA